METYRNILDPIIVLLTPTATKAEKDKASSHIGSTKYKKAAFDLITFGSDETVRCYNSMMQYIYDESNEDNIQLLVIFLISYSIFDEIFIVKKQSCIKVKTLNLRLLIWISIRTYLKNNNSAKQ